jgi:hypothetical protein
MREGGKGMADTYRVADLSQDAVVTIASAPSVDPERVAGQLKDISDAIAPVLAQSDPASGVDLESIELSLTIGAEGGVWFVAKGSAEASIKVTFGRKS